MDISFLLDAFTENKNNEALVCEGEIITYAELLSEIEKWRQWANTQPGIDAGLVVTLEADFSAASVALLLILIESDCIVVPIAENVEGLKSTLHEIAQAQTVIKLNAAGIAHCQTTSYSGEHPLYDQLRERHHPGLVLFSSGTTGVRKGVVHDFQLLLEKFRTPRHRKRTITFFLFDHIGGIDTLFYTLSNGGCVVTVANRQPETICHLIESFKVEVLPVSPTFINLLLLSELDKKYDLSSLEYVTYGSEVMPESTLQRLCERMPWVKTLQKYGLSEVGALRSKSESNDSVWVKLGGEGIELRVRDNMLEIKTNSAMLGYLNAESPFTDDGWFKTGDSVEVKGEYFKILGRKSEQINIGGEKFYPAEAETILAEIDNVVDVSVTSRPNPITGQMVVATFQLRETEDPAAFRTRVREFCQGRMPSFMAPQKIMISDKELHSERFKKLRK